MFFNECEVWQCWQQFPSEFEFNEQLLELIILVHVNRYTIDFIMDIQSKRRVISLFNRMSRQCDICFPRHSSAPGLPVHPEPDTRPLHRANTIQCSCNKNMINSSCLISIWDVINGDLNRYRNAIFAPTKRSIEGKKRASTSSFSDGSIVNLRERLRYIEPNSGLHCLQVWRKVHSYGLPTINVSLSENGVLKNLYKEALESNSRRTEGLLATIQALQKQLEGEAKSCEMPKSSRYVMRLLYVV